MNSTAVTFDCNGDELSGILNGCSDCKTGVLIVTGGPQYRVGSHRQFVELAWRLADCGYTTLRFDQRGHGDSDGTPRGFTALKDDIAAAINFLQSTGVERVVIWGLCDAASAALLYAGHDPRVEGLVLLNPWVRQEQTEARAQIASYYPARFMSSAFWVRLLTGKVNIGRSIRDLIQNIRLSKAKGVDETQDFVVSMLKGAQDFKGPVLLVLSGKDLTAQEFRVVADQPAWSAWVKGARVTLEALPQANHTFSNIEHKQQLADITCKWLDQSFR